MRQHLLVFAAQRRLMPLRPCEAMTIRSGLCFLAAAMMASETTSDLTVMALVATSFVLTFSHRSQVRLSVFSPLLFNPR